MKVILTERFDNLGGPGEIVTVADGYARNYLIPRGLAVEAIPANVSAWRSRLERKKAQEEKEVQLAQKEADRIDGRELTFPMKASEGGRLFGSVTSNDIASQLEIDRKRIQLPEPIKELGTHEVRVRFHSQVEAAVNVIVTREQEESEEEE